MLRRLMSGILAAVAFSAAPPARADEPQDRAIRFVAELKGVVKRDDMQPGKPVIEVDLSRTQVTDAGLKELVALKNLTTLNLGSTQVTDAGLKELAALKQLATLGTMT